MKRCSKCGVEKALDEFSRHAKRKDGLRGSCKACAAAFYVAHRERLLANKAVYRASHREEERQRQARWRAENPEKIKAWQKRYQARPERLAKNTGRSRVRAGFTQELFDAVLALQNNRCAICSVELPAAAPGRTGFKACADHDHAKKTPRGILCSACNSGLGFFGDSPERLIDAAFYLVKPTLETPA